MEVSTYEALVEEERQHLQYRAEHYPDNYALVAHNREEGLLRINQKRSELRARFPYAVVAEGGYPEHDYARRWCWQNIGPEAGPCSSWQCDYPGCPLALATEIIERGAWEDKSGEVHNYVQKRHSDPGEHSHEGEWTYLWLGKTGYDFGFSEFYFANETERQNFLAAFPTFNWSADWDKFEQDGKV